MHRRELVEIRFQVDRVFFRGDKACCSGSLAGGQESAHIGLGIRMMVAEAARSHDGYARRAQLGEKIPRASDAAERQARVFHLRSNNVTLHSPHFLMSDR